MIPQLNQITCIGNNMTEFYNEVKYHGSTYIATSKIDFSWTWNENMKKLKAQTTWNTNAPSCDVSVLVVVHGIIHERKCDYESWMRTSLPCEKLPVLSVAYTMLASHHGSDEILGGRLKNDLNTHGNGGQQRCCQTERKADVVHLLLPIATCTCIIIINYIQSIHKRISTLWLYSREPKT